MSTDADDDRCAMTPPSVPPPGRFPRSALLIALMLAAGMMVLTIPGEASALMRVVAPVRVLVVLGLWLALWRRWVSQRTVEGWLFWLAVLLVVNRMPTLGELSPERAALTMSTSGIILITLGLLLAPRRWRTAWAATGAVVVIVPSALFIVPRDPTVFASSTVFLAFMSVLLTVLEHNARRSETTWDLAHTDGLTGLANRRAMQTRLVAATAREDRRQVTNALILMDLDRFKVLNDSQGHQAGDEALQQVATILQGVTRPEDLVARWGGEEFLLLLPACGHDEAMSLAERLREALAEGTPITASFGVAEQAPADTPERWVSRADQALYEAKATGRNRVVGADPAVSVVDECDEPAGPSGSAAMRRESPGRSHADR